MHLLVAVDGSEPADRALEHALQVADAAGAAVTVVHAVQPDVYAETPSEPVSNLSESDRAFVLEGIERAETQGEYVLEEAAELAADHGHEVETVALYGDPVTEVAAYAAEAGVDGVYVGHQGRSRRTEDLMGSVAKELVARATVPVTVVH